MTTSEDPVVRITGAQIYDQLVMLTGEVRTMRGDLSARIDRLTDWYEQQQRQLERHEKDDQRRLDDHEQRLRSLDRRLWMMALGAVVLGTGGGAGVASLIAGG